MTADKDKGIKALVAGCRRGNKQDWTELIARLSPVVFSVCYRYRLSREEAFDVFGKVSLLLLENLTRLREEERIFGYISTIAFHEVVTIKVKSRLFCDGVDQYLLDKMAYDSPAQVRIPLELDDELRMMDAAYADLSKKCQELLRMLFLEPDGLSYREISRKLGIPVSSIGPTRGRCLEKLRMKMIEKGFEP